MAGWQIWPARAGWIGYPGCILSPPWMAGWPAGWPAGRLPLSAGQPAEPAVRPPLSLPGRADLSPTASRWPLLEQRHPDPGTAVMVYQHGVPRVHQRCTLGTPCGYTMPAVPGSGCRGSSRGQRLATGLRSAAASIIRLSLHRTAASGRPLQFLGSSAFVVQDRTCRPILLSSVAGWRRRLIIGDSGPAQARVLRYQ